MEKRIKVTGYFHLEELDSVYVDLSDPTGLSLNGFHVVQTWPLVDLMDLDFELED